MQTITEHFNILNYTLRFVHCKKQTLSLIQVLKAKRCDIKTFSIIHSVALYNDVLYIEMGRFLSIKT
jgi:hypothetical protein